MVKKSKSVKESSPSLALANIIVKGMEEKKGKDIRVLDLSKVKGAITNYFVICNADSTTQVDAIGQSVEEEVKKAIDEKPWHSEGYGNAEWVLLDYVDVVAHVFQTEKREFYGLEELWGDAEEVKI